MGAPVGNQNAVKGRRWSKSIERALEAWPNRAISLESNKGLDEAAYQFVNRLMQENDISFFRELGDRMDGKPAQSIGGDPDLPPVALNLAVSYADPASSQG